MIYAGAPVVVGFDGSRTTDAHVVLAIDTTRYMAAVDRLARVTERMHFAVEVRNLASYQVDALMYVRGAFDPAYSDPAARDRYVRAVAGHPTVGAVAATAFLRGWTTHRPGRTEPFVWHRYYAGVRMEVAA